ncbi:MAG TPA: GTP 3',8-cyclase MoaA [Magnetospirillaceae bacterium]|jgi:cyclic pyranopterin phosphate synthase
MIDPFGRPITYLRLSVTDRCDLRCLYCMAEDVEFLPKAELLSLEELERMSEAFINLGIRKIRLTGGEPLVRRGIMTLIDALGGHVAAGRLDELTMTTNGTQLAQHARALKAAGIKRINVSLDSLDRETFRSITRSGDLDRVLNGIAAAKDAGLAIKINAVAMKGMNEHEFDTLLAWCGEQKFDLTLIENMPMGVAEGGRSNQFLPLDVVHKRLADNWTFEPIDYRTGGPARYLRVAETGTRLGLITPLTHNFCEGCNRIRVTCTGTLYMCLGQEDAVDLRAPLRASESNTGVEAAILDAIAHKPKGHDFVIDRTLDAAPRLARHMHTTGG